jgi:uncharacterized membrane protein SpoIIM required for sporulation
MNEAAFVKRNKARWEDFEKIVKDQQKVHPDRLAELFIQITDDLSFSRTKYPNTRTTEYLNALANKIHLRIYRNKQEDRNRFVSFWKTEVPKAMYESRKPLFYAFVIFIISALMGGVSVMKDDTFIRLILGDHYVNMTLENIKNGNPTQVYATMDEVNMFFFITWNNVLVSFKTFIMGAIASVGTGFELFKNGIMVGSFIMFFYQENQLAQAFPVIMLHGTIELSAIVIAGAAGLVMGNSLIFPGTYSRIDSFKMGAMKGLKIILGLVPFFFVAAFIESFVTRYAFMHWGIKTFIIGTSAAIMIFYFILYPYYLKRHGRI